MLPTTINNSNNFTELIYSNLQKSNDLIKNSLHIYNKTFFVPLLIYYIKTATFTYIIKRNINFKHENKWHKKSLFELKLKTDLYFLEFPGQRKLLYL